MLLDLLKKMLAVRDADIINALLDKASNGDVSAIKLVFELTKAQPDTGGGLADFSNMTDEELLALVSSEQLAVSSEGLL